MRHLSISLPLFMCLTLPLLPVSEPAPQGEAGYLPSKQRRELRGGGPDTGVHHSCGNGYSEKNHDRQK